MWFLSSGAKMRRDLGAFQAFISCVKHTNCFHLSKLWLYLRLWRASQLLLKEEGSMSASYLVCFFSYTNVYCTSFQDHGNLEFQTSLWKLGETICYGPSCFSKDGQLYLRFKFLTKIYLNIFKPQIPELLKVVWGKWYGRGLPFERLEHDCNAFTARLNFYLVFLWTDIKLAVVDWKWFHFVFTLDWEGPEIEEGKGETVSPLYMK